MSLTSREPRCGNPHIPALRSRILAVCVLLLLPVAVMADGGITYTDFAADPASGIVFDHGEPPRNAILDELKMNPFMIPADIVRVPHKPHGAPGVALLDYDNDGDLDLYVTNSQDHANGLFSNQLVETGEFRFVDMAAAAGVDALDHDSSGACYGDIDNDGDHDLMVLGAIMPNRLYENRGDGTFRDITQPAGVGGGDLSTSSCSMGDVNNDGLLDIAVANTHTTWNDLLGIGIAYDFSEHNQLFVNTGGNVFEDMSAAAGFETLGGFLPEDAGSATLTWSMALADFDLDGDVDAFTLDDQGGVPFPEAGGVNYGLIHLHVNDGTGKFTDTTVEAGLAKPGNWMGISFADYNCDGNLDFFAGNVGDYPGDPGPVNPFALGVKSSRWFLGQGDGTFADPGVGDLVASVFGWGTSSFDYDNDGDPDITYVGAIDVGIFVDASNPGVIFRNEGCTADFEFDPALAQSADHTRRVDQGLATGDLNGDGFLDIVTVSNSNYSEDVPLSTRLFQTGSIFDDTSFLYAIFLPDPNTPGTFLWSGLEGGDGSLTVEISSGNDNHSAALTLRGTIGLTSGGRVNRDGIGAVVTFDTEGGKHQMVPIVGGASFASQNSLTAHFGLGQEDYADVWVNWPGGVKNRLLGLERGEHLVFPEIPCDYDDQFSDFVGYRQCVNRSLAELVAAGVIDGATSARFRRGAFECQNEDDSLCLDHRFRVETTWVDFAGQSDAGHAHGVSDEAGFFSFFHTDSMEVHVNVLEACEFNGYFWVYAAASTDVEHTLRITDTVTGEVKEYHNPEGHAPGAITDTTAFACP